MTSDRIVDAPVSATRHLGLDVGATNLKWVVMERGADRGWSPLDRGQIRTRVDEGPDAIVTQLGEVGCAAAAEWPEGSNQGDVPLALATKRAEQLGRLPRPVKRRRVLAYLARRGFTGREVTEMVGRVVG